MTALDDAIAKANEVLALERESRHSETILQHHDVAVRRDRLAAAMPYLARAVKAVAEALEENDQPNWHSSYERCVDDIRAAIERRLKEGK